MWMFKVDISNCLNQLHWHPNTAKLMRFRLTATLLMIMLKCGNQPNSFLTHIDVCRQFLRRRLLQRYLQDAKRFYTTLSHLLSAPRGIRKKKKNMHALTAEILGILIDLPTKTMRPKDNTIEKLFYVLFSVDAEKAQKRAYWQCLTSFKKKCTRRFSTACALSWHHQYVRSTENTIIAPANTTRTPSKSGGHS